MSKYHDHRSDCPFKFASLDVCDCVEHNMLDRIEALTAKVKLMDDLDVINGEKIEALTAERDELAAAKWNKQHADTMNDIVLMGLARDAATARAEKADAKLAAAVDWFEIIRDRAKGDYMAHTYYLDALAALTTIERSDDP